MTKKEQRLAVYNKYDGHCAYCGEAIKLTGFEVDHLTPILRGYKDRDVDTFENMMPACRACNRGKGGYKLENWRMILENKITELNRDVTVYKTAKRFGLVKETGVRVQFYFERFENLTICDVSNRRELFDKFYAWLDGLSQSEYDDMSLTDKCETFFFKIDK